MGDVRFGRYKPTKTTHFGEISNFEFTKLQISACNAMCPPDTRNSFSVKDVIMAIAHNAARPTDSSVSRTFCVRTTDERNVVV